MNSLEAEYSFLAPTWKLPTVATSSMYARTYGSSYLSTAPTYGPDLTLWNNTSLNSRYAPVYVPPTTNRRNYPALATYQRPIPPIIPLSQQNYQIPNGNYTQSGPLHYQHGNNSVSEDGLNLTISVHPNHEYEPRPNIPDYHSTMNRGLTYATHGQNNAPPQAQTQAQAQSQGQKRRVQIANHNRQTPSTNTHDHLSDRYSRNSNNTHSFSQNHTPVPNKSQQQSKPSGSNQYREHYDENKNAQNGNHGNVHEYLYGLAAPDPGSYVNTFKHQQRRLQEEKQGRKSVISDYKSFVQNGGFGPSFQNNEHQNYQDKITSEKKKKNYANFVRKANQQKLDEQKRLQDNPEQQKYHNESIPKSQRAREYAETIEKPHHMKPVLSTEFPLRITRLSSIKTTSLFNIQRHSNFDCTSSSDLLNEFDINQSRRSSLIKQRRIPLHNHHSIRDRSNSFIDLPSHIIGTGIPCRTGSLTTPIQKTKSTAKILYRPLNNLEKSSNILLQTTSNKNEKKIITTHSMNMRLPPTATVIINQTYIPPLKRIILTNNNLKKFYPIKI